MQLKNLYHKLLGGIFYALLLASPEIVFSAPVEFQQAPDIDLQLSLEKLLHKQARWPAVQEKKLAVFIADISKPEKIRIAHVNGNQMMYAASLPKIAILVAAFVKIEREQLNLTAELWKDMNRMIRHSSNSAATRVIPVSG